MSMRLLVLVATIGIAGAQVDTGTISGLVRDTSGGGIPGVQVTVRDESTGLTTGIGRPFIARMLCRRRSGPVSPAPPWR